MEVLWAFSIKTFKFFTKDVGVLSHQVDTQCPVNQ